MAVTAASALHTLTFVGHWSNSAASHVFARLPQPQHLQQLNIQCECDPDFAEIVNIGAVATRLTALRSLHIDVHNADPEQPIINFQDLHLHCPHLTDIVLRAPCNIDLASVLDHCTRLRRLYVPHMHQSHRLGRERWQHTRQLQLLGSQPHSDDLPHIADTCHALQELHIDVWDAESVALFDGGGGGGAPGEEFYRAPLQKLVLTTDPFTPLPDDITPPLGPAVTALRTLQIDAQLRLDAVLALTQHCRQLRELTVRQISRDAEHAEIALPSPLTPNTSLQVFRLQNVNESKLRPQLLFAQMPQLREFHIVDGALTATFISALARRCPHLHTLCAPATLLAQPIHAALMTLPLQRLDAMVVAPSAREHDHFFAGLPSLRHVTLRGFTPAILDSLAAYCSALESVRLTGVRFEADAVLRLTESNPLLRRCIEACLSARVRAGAGTLSVPADAVDVYNGTPRRSDCWRDTVCAPTLCGSMCVLCVRCVVTAVVSAALITFNIFISSLWESVRR